MNLTRRQKYNGNHKIVKNDNLKININFDLGSLNLMCAYVISENRNIRTSHLINMRNLFEIIDESLYINDIEKMKRLNFIRKGLEAKLVHSLKNTAIVIKYINGSIIDEDYINVNNFNILTTSELEWINKTVSQSLKYAFIYNDIDKYIDILTRFKNTDYKDRGSIVDEFEQLITQTQNKFRKVRAQSAQDLTFSLKDGTYEEVIRDIHERVTNPSNMLYTGMQGFNELLGGGIFSSRVYMLLGLTGGGKSLTLLNLAMQIKKFNKNYKPKDPTKIPVVLYITMENNISETIERLFTIATGDRLKDQATPEEVINRLKTEGELYLTDQSPIDIIIKYIPDKSIDTGHLYTLVEDLEDEGYEVICLIQDHIKKIRSVNRLTELRLELGEVVNEFKTFAAIKDIPVFTNSHLNRDAARTIDEAAKSNMADLTRMLGRANIGESMLMLDNLDASFIIMKEYDKDGNAYMVFKRVKIRYEASNRDYICQPFHPNIPIKLVEDLYAPMPVFKETLRPTPEENELYNDGIKKKSKYQDLQEIDTILTNNLEEHNIFDEKGSISRYNMNTVQYKDIFIRDNMRIQA